MFLLRTIPPPLIEDYTWKWDSEIESAIPHLLSSETHTPFAQTLVSIKPKHGGVGITRVSELSHIAYPASLAAVTWSIPIDTFQCAVDFAANDLPPLTNQDHDPAQFDDLVPLNDDGTYSPQLAIVTVWRTFSELPSEDLERIFKFSFDDVNTLEPTVFGPLALRLKLQREMTTAFSRATRASLVASTRQDVQTCLDNHGRCSSTYRAVVRKHVHSFTDWSAYHSLAPWIPLHAMESYQYQAAIRFQLLLSSKQSVEIGLSTRCACRNAAAPPKEYVQLTLTIMR